uniref:Lipocalin n=1 Tax=Rhipicephalus appendiculatus TaxID=34631 RepID=A0A131YN28_RHIAP
MRLINQQYIIYNRTHYNDRRRHSARLRGDFHARQPNVMHITKLRNMQLYSVESLLYASDNLSCGVLRTDLLSGSMFPCLFVIQKKLIRI